MWEHCLVWFYPEISVINCSHAGLTGILVAFVLIWDPATVLHRLLASQLDYYKVLSKDIFLKTSWNQQHINTVSRKILRANTMKSIVSFLHVILFHNPLFGGIFIFLGKRIPTSAQTFHSYQVVLLFLHLNLSTSWIK